MRTADEQIRVSNTVKRELENGSAKARVTFDELEKETIALLQRHIVVLNIQKKLLIARIVLVIC